ncbi:hypothetical protein Lalb_Chr19g0125851 [Lupinus albus]|uniref:Uncharacterized protein n=1 Tax=Lupinus albus TaxID=3870 RepID=A0A6A4NXQ6_LUPAL|nr:hypothetical protein Lalb_Chr19g0125851 [Lupinus albus]
MVKSDLCCFVVVKSMIFYLDEFVDTDKKSEGRSQIDKDAHNLQLLQFEEQHVLSSVATVLSRISGHGQWMRIEKLHGELVKQYSNIWHEKRVKKYLTSEEWCGSESKGKPWYGLLKLLRKYHEHFDINTKPKGYHWIHHSLFKSLIPLLMPGVLLPNENELAIFVCLK